LFIRFSPFRPSSGLIRFALITINKNENMSSGKVLLGLLAGVAAGALLGVLFAPEKGSVTRKKIAKKGEDYADVLSEKFNEFLNGITERLEKVKEEVTDFAEQGKTKIEESVKDVKAARVK
jgi:gas vesicle protein